MSLETEFDIDEEFLVTGEILSFKSEVVEFKPYFKAT